MEKKKSIKKDTTVESNLAFFRDVLSKVALGGLFIDRNRNIKYCNHKIERIFGYPFDKIVGKKTDILYADRRQNPRDKNEIYRILEEQGFHTGTARGFKKDGKRVDLELFTFTNKPKSGAVIFVKISEKTPEIIIDKERFLQNLLDNIPDMIFFKDTDNRFVLVNKAHAEALGRNPEEIIGKSDLDFFPKEIAEKYYADDDTVRKTGKPIVGKIEKASRPDGGMTYVSTTKIPHYDENGNVIGTIGITRNITEKMIAEEELRVYKDHLEDMVKERTGELEESNERLLRMYGIKSEFTSMVSHELRTPLAIIKEGVGLVTDGTLGPLNEKQATSLDMVLKNIERLTRLISDILDFSKLENKKMEFRIARANLNGIINQIAKGYENVITKKRNLRLKVKLDPSLPLVKFDSDRIIQVLHNLLDNAVKFTEKGYIYVESKAENRNVKISVFDTGCGIKSEYMPMVFEKFEQIPSRAPATKGGTGLGLAICKQIIEQLGGRIFVESEYGKGSNFYFTLPVER